MGQLAAAQDRFADAGRQRQGLFEPAQERQQDKEEKEIVDRRNAADQDPDAFRMMRADIAAKPMEKA